MTFGDRRGSIDDIKNDWFMFPFVEVIHLPLLPKEGDTPFSKGTAGYPPL